MRMIVSAIENQNFNAVLQQQLHIKLLFNHYIVHSICIIYVLKIPLFIFNGYINLIKINT